MCRFIVPALLLTFAGAVPAAGDSPTISSAQGEVVVHPVEHATFVLEADDLSVAVDPVGGAERSEAYSGVQLALVTDIHGDHFDAATLRALSAGGAAIVAPAAVAEQMDDELRAATTVLDNGETMTVGEVGIEAIPMYNLTEGRDFHPKGRGNGYVLELSGLRLYVSGDTEGVPEMRALEDIDAAFVCMNLPYTMDVEQAADAVVDMKPGIVYPYHYRGQPGFSDVQRFQNLVKAKDPDIEVRQLDWYPED